MGTPWHEPLPRTPPGTLPETTRPRGLTSTDTQARAGCPGNDQDLDDGPAPSGPHPGPLPALPGGGGRAVRAASMKVLTYRPAGGGWTARPRPGIRVLPCPCYAPWVGWSGLWRVCVRLLIDVGESRLVLVAFCQVVSKRLALV